MGNNLINFYLNNLSQQDSGGYVLSNRTFIKPLPPKGHLVHKNFLELPAETVKDLSYDVRSFKKALKGKANDHELGKINDIAMKIGGLAIAGYLMTKKQPPSEKVMELVGFASFFGAMSLWPKLALQLPAKLIHGINIRQEYVDSYGRQKMFFQDPQYIPWDLVSDKKINQIGDRMRVPKDLPNRREFIQEKMKKTAIQNNTMWMLTAGFATPIMSALVCNACEKPVKKFVGDYRSKQADKLITDFPKIFPKYMDNTNFRNLENVYKLNKDKPLTPELVKQIKKTITHGFDGITSSAVNSDLDELFGSKKYIIDDSVLDKTLSTVESVMHKTGIKNIFLDKNTLKNILKDNIDKELSEQEADKMLRLVCAKIKQNILQFNSVHPDESINDYQIKMLFSKLVKDDSLPAVLKSNSANLLTPAVMKKLKSVCAILTDFKAKNNVLDKFIYMKAAAAPESVIANTWNEITSSFPELFGINLKAGQYSRFDRKMTGKLIRERFEAISSDNTKYKQVIQALIDKISGLDAKMKMLDTSSASKESYVSIVDSVFDEAALKLDNLDMKETAKSLIGVYEGNVKNVKSSKGSLKNIQLSYVSNRLLGIRSSLYRLLNSLDFYKRISTLKNIQALDNLPREVKEEIVELCKKITVEGTTADFATKFFDLRNPNPNLSDLSQIEVKDGKVINKYLNKTKDLVDLPNDKNFFKNVMRLMYENDLHPETVNLLSNSVITNEVKQYRKDFIEDVGNAFYFAKPYHIVGNSTTEATLYTKFLRVGMPPDQMLNTTFKEMYHTKKWLKMFGGFGAVLLGVTVFSQFLFGKMKAPERSKND